MLVVLLGSILNNQDPPGTVAPLIPRPAKSNRLPGAPFVPDATTKLFAPSDLFAAKDLRFSLGKLPLPPATAAGINQINFKVVPSLGKEAYVLNIEPKRIDIAHASPAGALYAVQTLKLLRDRATGGFAPMRIEDSPRFEWRGLHLDVSRHFFDLKTIKRTLDLMKRFKLNVFHWHLVDDGGWRIQIDKYPLLTEIGSFRRGVAGQWSYSQIELGRPQADQSFYGGYYTKDEIREVVAYAAERGITVVPEIEMPGHTLPSVVAYPEIGCDNAKRYEGNTWTTNVYCAGKERSFQMLQDILEEVMELFPSPYIHIGGDEVDKSWWRRCASCQKRMADEKLESVEELQSYFIRRIGTFLTSKGRTLIGWDEILEGGLARNAAVMSWRGETGGVEAARIGHKVVMTPTDPCYFDYGYDSNSTRRVFEWDPVPAALTGAQRNLVLGGQANVWTEWIPNPSRMERMIWPRALAMAERLWSPADKNWDEFSVRLNSSLRVMDDLGIQYFLEEPEPPAKFVFGSEPLVLSAGQFPRKVYLATDHRFPASQWRQLLYQEIGENQTVYLAYKRGDGSLGDPAEVSKLRGPVAPTSAAGEKGLRMEWWLGKFEKIADFLGGTPDGTRFVTQIGLQDAPRPNLFGLRFRGLLSIPVKNLKLHLTSDDGSVLKLNGVRVINHDGLHAQTSKSIALRMTPGLYEFDLTYFESGGNKALKLEVEGDGMRRQPIPSAWLFAPKSEFKPKSSVKEGMPPGPLCRS